MSTSAHYNTTKPEVWANQVPKVYLCGPMGGLTFAEANRWRLNATSYLDRYHIEAINPLRHLDMADDEVFETTAYKEVMKTDRSIKVRDRMDVKRSNLMLANLLAVNEHSLGSGIEFGWADAWDVPVVTVLDLDSPRFNQFNHPMIRDMSDWMVPTLDAALLITRRVLR